MGHPDGRPCHRLRGIVPTNATNEAIVRRFVTGGRLTVIPARRSKRLAVLDWLAQAFEPGHTYPEATVNQVLRRFHPDHAALRRYLVDEGFMARRDGYYWRAGGTFDVG
jgi:hypothetical protein